MRAASHPLAASALVLALTLGPTAMASPPHGDGGHTHHVHTPPGCVDVDQIGFRVDDRGLHRGAGSSGVEKGIWHGPCHG